MDTGESIHAPAPCALAIGAHGLGVAWSDSYGPVVARMRSVAAQRPEWCRHLAAGVVPDAPPPVPVWWRDALFVAFATADAVGVTALDASRGARLGRPQRLHPGASASDLAVVGDRLVLASVDARGVVVSWLDPRGGGALEHTVRVAEAQGLSPLVQVVAGGTDALVLWIDASDDLALARVGPVGGVPAPIRHALRGRPNALRALAVRRLVVASVGYPDADRIDVATFDDRGAVRERPHAAVSVAGARLVHPNVVWSETTATLTFLDATSQTFHARSLGDGDAVRVRLARVPGPHATAYFWKHLVVTEIVPTDERTELRLRKCDARGGDATTAMLDVTPSDLARRRREAEASALVARLPPLLSGRGYRGAGTGFELDPSGLGLSLLVPDGTARVRIRPGRDRYRIDLSYRTADAAPGRRGLLRRVLGALIGPVGEARRWANGVLGEGADLLAAEPGRHWRTLSLATDELPGAVELLAWLRRVARAPEDTGGALG